MFVIKCRVIKWRYTDCIECHTSFHIAFCTSPRKALGIEHANLLQPLQFFSIILLSLKMVAHWINFLSEYSKCSRLEINLDYMAANPKTVRYLPQRRTLQFFLTWALSCWNQNLLYFAFNTGRISEIHNISQCLKTNFRSSTNPLREIQPKTISKQPRNGLFLRLLVIFFAHVFEESLPSNVNLYSSV